jgi:hypothetical protein
LLPTNASICGGHETKSSLEVVIPCPWVRSLMDPQRLRVGASYGCLFTVFSPTGHAGA